MVMLLVAVATAVIMFPVTENPAAAGDGGGGSRDPGAPVEQNGNDIIGEIERQVGMLNSGGSGSGGPPPSCEWRDANGVTHNDGTARWRPPGQGHDFWAEGWEGEVGDGTIFRYECWHPSMMNPDGSCRTDAPQTEGCLGDPIMLDWCDASFLCLFDAVNPQNLAELAVDQFLRTIGPPDAAFSPDAENGETLVNFDTWMWVINVNAAGALGPWPMSVPGISVSASASLDDLDWDMGNGDTLSCPITTSEAEARENCSYNYLRSSAGEQDDAYQGTVTANWHVVWNGNALGQPISGELDAPRVGEFSAAVSEAQGLNTDGD